MEASELFVFVGAGVSRPAPTSLLTFNEIRDSVLLGLDLPEYVHGTPQCRTELVDIAAGMFPERFLLALAESGFALESWLAHALGRVRPNAAHTALAALARAGAKVWTVNYDHNIEQATSPALETLAWPDAPRTCELLKPHGSLGGQLIATATQVVKGLEPAWLKQLRRDVADRSTVIFIGYSGRDLDFHPYWDDALASVEQVLWFDFPDPAGRAYKRALLPTTDRRSRLTFPEPAPAPDGVDASRVNPCWDFLTWCRQESLLGDDDIDQALARALFDDVEPMQPPRLSGDLASARAALLGAMGDYRRQRREYARALARPRQIPKSVANLAVMQLNHGGRPTAVMLSAARALPPLGRTARAVKEMCERKRLTALSKIGAHSSIIAATGPASDAPVSTYGILRAESLRVTGSLTEAATVADGAYRQALSEQHNVRIAHAAYQKCQALVWADRTDEAERALRDELDPQAALAASRWVAWASFLRSEIAVRRGDVTGAREQVELAVQRFLGEALVDGVISAELVLLTVSRREADDDAFAAALARVRRRQQQAAQAGRYYTQGHPFTEQVIELEQAEFARARGNRDEGRARYESLSRSQYPLHVAFGNLGCALLADSESQTERYGAAAAAAGARIGQQLIVARCAMLEAHDVRAGEEMFFC